ncbi:MAG: hypothetical protein A2V66_12125 [Ignavibacteria bacterium RBG_13_36_8]|nr:MAG: hypothetical protein A2V66_12125 [Ignavibacteria bacterium RBG_13_36_8]
MATFYNAFSLEPKGETIVQVCTGSGCQAKGAGLILDTLERTLGIKAGQTTKDKKYTLEAVSCLGVCELAPVIKIGDELVGEVSAENIKEILATKPESKKDEKKTEIMIKGIPSPIAMRETDGSYSILKRLIKDKTSPTEIITELKKSELKGRGGGGFLTGDKWEECRRVASAGQTDAVLVCNSSIIELSAHAVIEGMLIGALATGATEGHVCFRQEHLAALKRFEAAVEEARGKKLLGQKILGSDLNFEIKIHRGGGGFVIGESSALLQSISGKVGEPQPKYIHNAERGYKGKPTIVNNIETWANVPIIFEKGAEWFKNIGNGGTKVLFLSGDVKKSGFVEVPMGTSLKEVIEELGQGVSKKKRQLKAVQIGGPSGSFLPADKLNCKIDYDCLEETGSIMGSGAVVVKNNRKCIVDAAKYSVDFLLNESCGKCTPCREGLFALSNILSRITNGEGMESDIEMMQEIAQTMKESSLCQFGQTAANPILSMIEHFNDELEEHLDEKICRSGVCKSMVSFSINQEICNGCTLCLIKCPSDAIVGEKKKPHQIITAKCTKCGVCFEVCNLESVEVN